MTRTWYVRVLSSPVARNLSVFRPTQRDEPLYWYVSSGPRSEGGEKETR